MWPGIFNRKERKERKEGFFPHKRNDLCDSLCVLCALGGFNGVGVWLLSLKEPELELGGFGHHLQAPPGIRSVCGLSELFAHLRE